VGAASTGAIGAEERGCWNAARSFEHPTGVHAEPFSPGERPSWEWPKTHETYETPIGGEHPSIPDYSEGPLERTVLPGGQGVEPQIKEAYAQKQDIHEYPDLADAWRPLRDEDARAAFAWPVAEGNRFSLDSRVRTARLVSLVPRNAAELLNTYGSDVHNVGSLTTQLSRLRVALDAEGAIFGGHLTDDNFELFLLRHKDEGLLVFLGHSTDDGAFLRLPSGVAIEVPRLHSLCAHAGARCLVLTCYGSDFKLTTEISSDEALVMWKAGRLALQQQPDLTVGGYIEKMRDARSTHANVSKAKVALVAVAAAGGAAYVVVSTQKKNGAPPRPAGRTG
jgi:hypothetical protein